VSTQGEDVDEIDEVRQGEAIGRRKTLDGFGSGAMYGLSVAIQIETLRIRETELVTSRHGSRELYTGEASHRAQ
jgi:hypothetical protein